MLNTAACPFRLDDLVQKDADYGKVGEFSGYASTFGNRDRDNDVIEKGAFGQITEPRAVKLLWQHDMREPIGVWKAISEDAHGLAVKGQLNLEVQRGREAYALMKQGALGDMSIGFKVPKGGTYEKEVAEGDGRTRLRHIKTIKLYEISVVTIPANSQARITAIKSAADMPTIREFEAVLRDADFPRKERAELIAEYKALLMKCGFATRDAGGTEDVPTGERDAAEKAKAEELARKAAEAEAAEAKAVAEKEATNKALELIAEAFGTTVANLRNP